MEDVSPDSKKARMEDVGEHDATKHDAAGEKHEQQGEKHEISKGGEKPEHDAGEKHEEHGEKHDATTEHHRAEGEAA